MKPMVKATMPTVKAETRKTCDTEPAAGGIARTMTLARRAPGLRRARSAPERNFHAHKKAYSYETLRSSLGEEQRTRNSAIRKRSRSPGHRQLSLAVRLFVRGGALEKKSVGNSVSISVPLDSSSALEFYITLRFKLRGIRRGDRGDSLVTSI